MGGAIVLHTAEADAGQIVGVVNFLTAFHWEPHWVYDPATREAVPLTGENQPARSLLWDGGKMCWQVEIVGRARLVPFYSDDWYKSLREWLMAWAARLGVDYRFPYEFVSYPESYGDTAPQRLTEEQWFAVEGIVGQEHVPHNLHGDPGALDLVRMRPPVPQPKDEQMPDYILRDAHNVMNPWLAIYPNGGIRHIGHTEAGYLEARTPAVPIIDEDDPITYRLAVKQSGTDVVPQ